MIKSIIKSKLPCFSYISFSSIQFQIPQPNFHLLDPSVIPLTVTTDKGTYYNIGSRDHQALQEYVPDEENGNQL